MLATVIYRFVNGSSGSSSNKMLSIPAMEKIGAISSPNISYTEQNAVGLLAFVAANDQ